MGTNQKARNKRILVGLILLWFLFGLGFGLLIGDTIGSKKATEECEGIINDYNEVVFDFCEVTKEISLNYADLYKECNGIDIMEEFNVTLPNCWEILE